MSKRAPFLKKRSDKIKQSKEDLSKNKSLKSLAVEAQLIREKAKTSALDRLKRTFGSHFLSKFPTLGDPDSGYLRKIEELIENRVDKVYYSQMSKVREILARPKQNKTKLKLLALKAIIENKNEDMETQKEALKSLKQELEKPYQEFVNHFISVITAGVVSTNEKSLHQLKETLALAKKIPIKDYISFLKEKVSKSTFQKTGAIFTKLQKSKKVVNEEGDEKWIRPGLKAKDYQSIAQILVEKDSLNKSALSPGKAFERASLMPIISSMKPAERFKLMVTIIEKTKTEGIFLKTHIKQFTESGLLTVRQSTYLISLAQKKGKLNKTHAKNLFKYFSTQLFDTMQLNVNKHKESFIKGLNVRSEHASGMLNAGNFLAGRAMDAAFLSLVISFIINVARGNFAAFMSWPTLAAIGVLGVTTEIVSGKRLGRGYMTELFTRPSATKKAKKQNTQTFGAIYNRFPQTGDFFVKNFEKIDNLIEDRLSAKKENSDNQEDDEDLDDSKKELTVNKILLNLKIEDLFKKKGNTPHGLDNLSSQKSFWAVKSLYILARHKLGIKDQADLETFTQKVNKDQGLPQK